MTKMVYLASPYTHPDKEVEDLRASQVTKFAAKQFAKYGIAFILPITMSKGMADLVPEINGKFETWI